MRLFVCSIYLRVIAYRFLAHATAFYPHLSTLSLSLSRSQSNAIHSKHLLEQNILSIKLANTTRRFSQMRLPNQDQWGKCGATERRDQTRNFTHSRPPRAAAMNAWSLLPIICSPTWLVLLPFGPPTTRDDAPTQTDRQIETETSSRECHLQAH